MKCTKCGARLLDTDQFCPECGAKVIKEKRCTECGALLRDSTKFCHKCGSPVEEKKSTIKAAQETLDIPIDAIERNILTETAAEIRADHRTANSPHRTAAAGNPPGKSTSPKSAASHVSSERSESARSSSAHASSGKSAPSKKKSSTPAPPPNKRASYYEEEDWDDEDWDDEDDDGVDAITVMTAIVGCVLLVVVAVLGYNLYRQYVPKNYDKAAEEMQDEETDIPGQEMDEEPTENADNGSETFTLTVIHNVNVRDNPSTSGTNVLKVAQEGETYTSTGSVDGGEWYAILLEDGSTGYVFHEYVTVN